MTECNQSFFSGTLVYSNIFSLGLIRGFLDAWCALNKLLTELNSPISGVHFSFATIFQHLTFVRHCSYSKLKFSHGSNLQWWKPFVDMFFHLREIRKQTLVNIKKNSSNFEQRERKYANTWGGGGRARGQKSLQKHSYCIPFVFLTISFHSAFTFMRFQSCNWTVISQFYHFPDRNNFLFNFFDNF